MDPIYTWLDPVAVRQLADGLLQPSREAAASSANDGFGDGFIGFEADPTALDIAPAPMSGLSSSLAETSAKPAMSFAEKVERFGDWLRVNHAAKGLFILDREGAVVFGESGHEYLHFLARSMALAPRRAGASAASVRVKISAEAVLEIIPSETLVLGAVISEALAPDSVAEILKEFSALASTR